MDSLIAFADYGLSDAEVRSANAMAPYWRGAVADAMRRAPPDDEFEELLGGLVGGLSDVAWQRRWIRLWDRLGDQGVALGELFRPVFAAIETSERALLAAVGTPRTIHLDLCAAFRRAVLAACCGAIETREAVRNLRSGVSGELTALHSLDAMAAGNRRVGVVSLSLLGRDSDSHVSARDLQQLPGLIFERLQRLLRPQDLIFAGREGEWLLLLPDVDSKVQPSLAVAAIQRDFAEPVRLDSGRPVALAVTVGAALLPDHGRDADGAIRAARLARWAAAAAGEGFGWFRSEQDEAWQRRAALADELQGALLQDALELHLQPQVDLATRICLGAELLLRWRRSDGEWVPPPLAVELIEQNGWRQAFTEWLLRSAMRIAVDLQVAGIPVTLSINLTAPDLRDPDLPDLLAQYLETWDVPGDRFILELTESAMMGDRAHCLAVIARLRQLGFRMSLDDFGTGYSSLSYLVSLPIHELKLDRSFVVAMFDSEDNMRIVRTILDLANDLGMVPLAEGIDDPRQAEQLRALGCRMGQGFLYAQPMPLAEFVAWYRQRRRA